MSDVIVRTYEPSDRESLVRLWSEVFPDDPPRNAPERMIDQKMLVQPELFFVALVENEIVGAVMAGFEGTRGWIHHLAVVEGHRRMGIARVLMEHAERGLIELGCPKVNLQVRARNKAVVEFYRRVGYEVEDLVSMGKMLKTLCLVGLLACGSAGTVQAQAPAENEPSVLLRPIIGAGTAGVNLGAEVEVPLMRNFSLVGGADLWSEPMKPACVAGIGSCRVRDGAGLMAGWRASTRNTEGWWLFAQGMIGGFHYNNGPNPWVPALHGRAGLAIQLGGVALEGAGQFEWLGQQSSTNPTWDAEIWSGVLLGVSVGL